MSPEMRGDSFLSRILVVDDDRECAAELTELLICLGYEASPAHSLSEARAICENRIFDFALVDVELGADSGVDLAIQWRAAGNGVPRPFLLSGRKLSCAEQTLLEGTVLTLSKPLDLDLLEALIVQQGERPERNPGNSDAV